MYSWFRPRNHLIVRKSRSRPYRSYPIDWCHIQKNLCFEKILKFLKVCVPVYFQNFNVIWSKMNGGFDRCRHKQSPDQYVGLQNINTNNWCLFCEIQFFPQVLEDFPIWMSAPRSSFVARAELEVSSLRPSFLVHQNRLSSCRRSCEFAVGSWLLSRTSLLSRDETTLIQFLIPRAVWITRILRRIFLRPPEVPWHQIHRSRFRHCRPLFGSTLLSSLGHDTPLSVWKKMAARKHREIHDNQQRQKMVPFITCEISLGQYLCELVLGVNVFDLDMGLQINSVKQPTKSNSVGSGYVSHRWTSVLDDHVDHCFVVFKDIQQSFLMRRLDVWVNNINIIQIIDHSLRLLAFVNRVRWRTNFTFVL